MFRLRHKHPEQVELVVSNTTVVRVLLLILLSLIGLAALHKATHALTLIFTAFFLVLAFNAPVHWIAQRLPGSSGGTRILATATPFIGFFLVLGAFIASMAPPLT